MATTAEFPQWGYWTDWTGATRKVKIIDETLSGKYVVVLLGEIFRVDKDKVELEW